MWLSKGCVLWQGSVAVTHGWVWVSNCAAWLWSHSTCGAAFPLNFLLNQSHSLLGKGDSHISIYKDNLERGVGDQHPTMSCCFRGGTALPAGPGTLQRGQNAGCATTDQKMWRRSIRVLSQAEQSRWELLMGMCGRALSTLLRFLLKTAAGFNLG